MIVGCWLKALPDSSAPMVRARMGFILAFVFRVQENSFFKPHLAFFMQRSIHASPP